MREYIDLGKKIYNIKYHKELRRMIIFVMRCLREDKKVHFLLNYFQEDTVKKAIIQAKPCIIEQMTRSFFYKNSTSPERLQLIREHFDFCLHTFNESALLKIYTTSGLIIWENAYQEKALTLNLHFDPGERKEGLLTLSLNLDKTMVYQITFWFGQNSEAKKVLWLGALQGMNGGSQTIKQLTKHFYGYRTKNLIFYALRCVASSLNIAEIRAVSNEGFYANNHLRMDRKLKTDLDAFWRETGGEVLADSRFYRLPVIEPRKSLEEVVSHKRSLYRKRFAALDDMAENISCSLQKNL